MEATNSKSIERKQLKMPLRGEDAGGVLHRHIKGALIKLNFEGMDGILCRACR